MTRQERKESEKKLIQILKEKQHFMLICSDGKQAQTIFNGEDQKIVAALCASLLKNPRTKSIIQTMLKIMESDLLKGQILEETKK